MNKSKPRISIIGVGVVGRCIGRLLRERGFPIAGLFARSREDILRARRFIGGGVAARSAADAAGSGEIIFLTVPDRAVLDVCREIAEAKGFKPGAIVFHCAGSFDASVLASARRCRAHVGALHPLQSFASPEEAIKRLRGTWFTFDGDRQAEAAAEIIVRALRGKTLKIRPGARVTYHAASCILSNYVVALADLALDLLVRSGLSRKEAAAAAMPLLRTTVMNVEKLGVPAALTGPIARGDVETVKRHLAAMKKMPDEVQQLYRSVGLYTIGVAKRKGTLRETEAEKLKRMLSAK